MYRVGQRVQTKDEFQERGTIERILDHLKFADGHTHYNVRMDADGLLYQYSEADLKTPRFDPAGAK